MWGQSKESKARGRIPSKRNKRSQGVRMAKENRERERESHERERERGETRERPHRARAASLDDVHDAYDPVVAVS